MLRKRVPGVGSGDRKSSAADGSQSDWRHDQTVSSGRMQSSSTRDISRTSVSRTSTGQRIFAAFGSRTWNRLPTALRLPQLSLASFKRKLKTHLSVPALDSAGCSCGCRVPSSGAVVTVQRVRRRLEMSRLDSTRQAKSPTVKSTRRMIE